MKLIYATTIFIGATAKQSENASAGLRGQQEQGERDLFLFDNWGSNNNDGSGMGGDSQASFVDFGAMGGSSSMMDGNQCGDTCTDSQVCDSFLSLAAMFDPTSVFEDACNAGCFPTTRLEHCEVVCGTTTEGDAEAEESSEVTLETEAAVSSAIARAGFIDVAAAKETMCGDCKFYSCCVDSSVAADPTKYEACKGHLDENLQHQAIGDSLLEEVFSNVAETIGAVMENVAEVVDTVMDEFTQELNITDALQVAEDGGEDGAFPPILSQIVDSFATMFEGEDFDLENMNLFQEWPDFSISDWGDGAVWSGTDDATGLAVFGQVPGSFQCPETCTNEDLCKNVFVGMGDSATLENACNSNCLPAPGSCVEICGNTDGPEFLATITDMACKSCTFFECCSAEAQGDDSKFNTCQVHLPDKVDLLSDIGFDGSEVQEWIDSFDWSSMTEDLDLSDTFENLQVLFDEAMANFESFPVTCNKDTCPITGLCDMNINMASMDFDEICTENALFQCGEGLEKMCTDECDSPQRLGFAPMCALCNVATCCSTAKEDGKSFQDCAMGALTYQEDAMEDEEINGGTVDISTEDILVAEETSSESNESPATVTPDEEDAVIEQSSPSTEGSSASETVESSASTTPDDEEEEEEEEEELPELQGPVQMSISEVNRVDNIQSGSYAHQVSTFAFSFASAAALFLASL